MRFAVGVESSMGVIALAEKRSILYLLSATAFLGPFSQSIYSPSIVAVRAEFGTSYVLVLATISAYSFALGASQVFYGPIVDALSGRRVLLAGLLLYGGASLLAYFSPTIVLLTALRAAQGLGIAACAVVGGSLITDLFASHERARAMGFYQMALALGMVLGPVAGSIIAALAGWRATFLFLILAGALMVGMNYRRLPAYQAATEPFAPANALRVIARPATLGTSLLAFVQYYCLASFVNLLAILLARPGFGLEASWVGPLLAPFTAGIAVGSSLGGRFADRHGRRRSIRLGASAAAACSGVFALVAALPPSWPLLLPLGASMALLGVALGFNWPGQLSLMVEWFPRLRGTAIGVYNFIRFMGSTLGALAGGYLTDRYGVSTAYVVVFVLLGAGVAIAWGTVSEPG